MAGLRGARARKVSSKLTVSQTDATTLTGSVEADVPTHLARVLGVQTLAVDMQSTASLRANSTEIAMVLDNTGSMNGSKLQALKSAANDLVDTVPGGTSANAGTVKISLVNARCPWPDRAPGLAGLSPLVSLLARHVRHALHHGTQLTGVKRFR